MIRCVIMPPVEERKEHDNQKTDVETSKAFLRAHLNDTASIFQEAADLAAKQREQYYANQIEFVYTGLSDQTFVDQLNDYLAEKDAENEYDPDRMRKCRYEIWQKQEFTLRPGEIIKLPENVEIPTLESVYDQEAQILVEGDLAILVTQGKRFLYDPRYIGTGENGSAHVCIDLDGQNKEEFEIIKMQCGALITQEIATGQDEKGNNIYEEQTFFEPTEEPNVQEEHELSSLYKPDGVNALGRGLAKVTLAENFMQHIFGNKVTANDEAIFPINQKLVYVLRQKLVPGITLKHFVKSDLYAKMNDAEKLDFALLLHDALINLHKQTGAFYRDVRPENVLVDVMKQGTIKIAFIDLGAAAKKGQEKLMGVTENYTHPDIVDKSTALNPLAAKKGEYAAVKVIFTEEQELYSLREVYRFMGLDKVLPELLKSNSLDGLHSALVKARAALESGSVKSKAPKRLTGTKVAEHVRRIESVDEELGRPPSPRRPPSPPTLVTGTTPSPGWEPKPGGGWMRKGGGKKS